MNTYKKLRTRSLLFTLWVFGLLFIIGGVGNLAEQPLAGLSMLALGVVLLPPTWRLITKAQPSLGLRRYRLLGATLLFIAACIATPTSTQPAAEAAPAATKSATQQLHTLTRDGNTVTVTGLGNPDTNYTLTFSDSPKTEFRTDSNGSFSHSLPSATQTFGSMQLTRDTNGLWFGGKETYDTKYFTLGDTPALTSTQPEPTIFGISGDSTYELSGLYTPKKTLLLKAGESTLASTTVDSSGRYVFTNIALATNYTQVAIYENVSTGWFTSRHDKRTDAKYLDIEKRLVSNELPLYTKEVISTETIPFTSRTVSSARLAKGQTDKTQTGVAGTRTITHQVTYRGNQEVSRTLAKDDVSLQPIEEILTVGTYVAPPVASVPKKQTQQAPQTTATGRTGATCRDGTASRATGSGACSHHGGVAAWRY